MTLVPHRCRTKGLHFSTCQQNAGVNMWKSGTTERFGLYPWTSFGVLVSWRVNSPFPFTKQAIVLIPLITAAYETAAEVHWNLPFPSHFPPTKRSSSCANQWQQLLLRLVDNLLGDCRSAPPNTSTTTTKKTEGRKSITMFACIQIISGIQPTDREELNGKNTLRR